MRGRCFQPLRNGANILEADIPLTPLDTADVRAMEPNLAGESFLRNTQLFSTTTNGETKGSTIEWFSFSHS